MTTATALLGIVGMLNYMGKSDNSSCPTALVEVKQADLVLQSGSLSAAVTADDQQS